MERFYFRFRILLMTFAFGLASVFVFSGSLKLANEVPVDLLNVQSESPIIVFPRYMEEMPWGGGSACSGKTFERFPIQRFQNKFQITLNLFFIN